MQWAVIAGDLYAFGGFTVNSHTKPPLPLVINLHLGPSVGDLDQGCRSLWRLGDELYLHVLLEHSS